MIERTFLWRVMAALAFIALTHPALAQAIVGGNSDPTTVGRAALLIFLAVLAVVAIGYWAAVGAACYRGAIATQWIWGGVAGTLLIACCGYIATRLFGGGGGGGIAL